MTMHTPEQLARADAALDVIRATQGDPTHGNAQGDDVEVRAALAARPGWRYMTVTSIAAAMSIAAVQVRAAVRAGLPEPQHVHVFGRPRGAAVRLVFARDARAAVDAWAAGVLDTPAQDTPGFLAGEWVRSATAAWGDVQVTVACDLTVRAVPA